MKPVFVLLDAAEDLELGKAFYDSQEKGIGDYFVDSLLTAVEVYAVLDLRRDPLWIRSELLTR